MARRFWEFVKRTLFFQRLRFFADGLGNALTFPISVGATTILLAGRPTPEGMLDIIEGQQPSIFCCVPNLYGAVVAALANRALSAHRLRLCISAGAALPADIGHPWRGLFGVDILDGVGSTEMLHIFLSNREGVVTYGTSGIAVPGYKLRCVTEKGKEIVPGELGELLVKGGSSADGYCNQRAKSRETFEGVWTRAGDKYKISEAGHYIYWGRTDDMFKVLGVWLSPFEVEQALFQIQRCWKLLWWRIWTRRVWKSPKPFWCLTAVSRPQAYRTNCKIL